MAKNHESRGGEKHIFVETYRKLTNNWKELKSIPEDSLIDLLGLSKENVD